MCALSLGVPIFFYSNTLNPKPSTFQIFFLSRLFPPSVFLPHFTHKTHRQTHRKYKNVFFDVHRCFREAHLQGTPPPLCPRTEDAFSVARPRARALSDAKSAVQRVDFFVFFFWRLGRFFSAPRQKGGLHTRKILQRRRRRKRRRRERGGVFFYPVATKKRARIARESARETRCDRARAGGDVAFSSSSLFFARAKGAAVWILKFHSIRVGRCLVSYLLVDLFRCPIQQNARADRGASLFPSPMNNGRTNEQVNFKTSRTATKARAGFSVNAAAVRRLPFCISRRIVLDRVHEELSKKKKRKFYRFLSFFEENFDSSTHQEVPHKKE